MASAKCHTSGKTLQTLPDLSLQPSDPSLSIAGGISAGFASDPITLK